MYLLAQLESTSTWVGLTGATAWATLAYLFVTNRICTQANADKQIADWRSFAEAYQKVAQLERDRADKCEARMLNFYSLAERATVFAEKHSPKIKGKESST